eukprot:2655664-Alexandrium_andersonii.AAC.1
MLMGCANVCITNVFEGTTWRASASNGAGSLKRRQPGQQGECTTGYGLMGEREDSRQGGGRKRRRGRAGAEGKGGRRRGRSKG